MPPAPKKQPIEKGAFPKSPAAKRPLAKRTPRKKAAPAKKPWAWKIWIALMVVICTLPFYYGYLLSGLTSAYRWVKDEGTNPNYKQYKSFGIRMPDQYAIHGIDVSSYQGKIDWARVKAMKDHKIKLGFAIVKATEGLLLVDPYFSKNWHGTKKAGIIRGAYHYFRPRKSGVWQAKFFMQTAKFKKGDLPPIVDVEELNGVDPEKMRAELSDCLLYIEEKTGTRPMIYSGLTFYKDYLKGYFDEYPLWIAHYYQPELQVDRQAWVFWQHSDKGKVNGINHITDFNVFNGDSLALKMLLIKK